MQHIVNKIMSMPHGEIIPLQQFSQPEREYIFSLIKTQTGKAGFCLELDQVVNDNSELKDRRMRKLEFWWEHKTKAV